MTQEEPTTKKTGKKYWKWAGITLASLFVLLLLMVVAVYLVLRAGTFSQSAVEKINPITSVFGLTITKLGRASIDVFGHIEINDLALHWEDAQQGNADLSAKLIRVDYSLQDLLDNVVILELIQLEKINIKASLKAQPEQTVASESEPMPLSELEALFIHPPLDISLHKLAINDVSFDLTLENPDATQQLSGKLNALEFGMNWDNETLGLSNKLVLDPQDNKWNISQSVNNTRSTIAFAPAINSVLKFKVDYPDNHWQIDLLDLNQNIVLREFSFTEQAEGKETTTLLADTLSLELLTKSDNNEPVKQGVGLENIRPFALTTVVKSNAENSRFKLAAPHTPEVSADLNNYLLLNLKTQVASLFPLQLRSGFNLTETLQNPVLNYTDADNALDLKKTHINLKTSGEVRVKDQQIADINNQTELVVNGEAVKLKSQNPNEGIRLQFKPSLVLNSHVLLPDLNKLDALSSNVDLGLKLDSVDVTQYHDKSKESYKIKSNVITTKLNFANNNINAITDLELVRADIAQLNKPIDLKQNLKVQTDIQAEQGQVNTDLMLNGKPLLNALLKFTNRPNKFRLAHDIKLDLPLWLKQIHASASALDDIGYNRIALSGESELSHGAENIQNANMDKLEQWPVSGQGKIRIQQISAPKTENGIKLTAPLYVQYDLDKTERYKANLTVNSKGIQAPPLLQPLPIALKSNNTFNWPLKAGSFNGEISLANESHLNYDLSLKDQPGRIKLGGQLKLIADVGLKEYLADLMPLQEVGKLTIALKPDVTVSHKNKSLLDFQMEKPEDIGLDASLDLKVEQDAANPGKTLVLKAPLKVNENLQWHKGALNSVTQYEIGQLAIPEQLALANIKGGVELNTQGGTDPSSLHVKLMASDGEIKISQDQNSLSVGKAVTPMNFEAFVDKKDKTIMLNSVSYDQANGLLRLDAGGTLTTDGTFAQLNVLLQSDLNKQQLSELGYTTKGRIGLPLAINFSNNSEVSLNGDLSFDNLSVTGEELDLKAIDGKLLLSEELIMKDNQFAFSYLLDTDPFQRVDFSRIQPYLNAENILKFENIHFGNISVGPGMLNMALKQNLLQIQRMDMDAYDGQVLAQFNLDMRPGEQSFGLLSRIKGLDTGKLLGTNVQAKSKQKGVLTTRSAINFKLADRLMEGNIDVSEINQSLLLQFLEFADPDHKDEQIETVRSALRFSYPESVSVEMLSGLMNISVSISSLPAPLKIRGLPLTPLIQQQAEELQNALNTIPLKTKTELLGIKQ
ncbi:MAG: hypothetical protein R3240_02595 [Gammaproteobacteria bacterium]|nr:hypothetical protein [Gammaproteobacteria bacterium]